MHSLRLDLQGVQFKQQFVGLSNLGRFVLKNLHKAMACAGFLSFIRGRG